MNVNELQSVQARERQSDSLQELRPSFYDDAAEFIADLREERASVAADVEDPFSDPEVTRLTDDIRTAEGTIEAIYERRVGKIVKLASLAASDMPTEETGLTTEERELYETLVDAIEAHREGVLAKVMGDGPSDAGSGRHQDQRADETDAASGGDEDVGAADVMGGDSGASQSQPGDVAPPADENAGMEQPPIESTEPPESSDQDSASKRRESAGEAREERSDEGESGPDDDRTTVRITEDVGPILAVDQREYDLATDDVVTLPTENATPLIERDAAEPID